MRVAIIVGTRPEIIKMSSIVKACRERDIECIVVHTGQHYSYDMEGIFYEQLGLGLPRYNLGIKSTSPFLQSEHTGRMLIAIEKILLDEKPNVVLVQGDTNTVLAAAICVNKLKTNPINMPIKLGHVEAGLRSFDMQMTEEINRKLADHMSDYLFVPTELSKQHVVREAIDPKIVFVTGNTIVDAVKQNQAAAAATDILKKYELTPQKYCFVTAHRQENVDSYTRYAGILEGLRQVKEVTGLEVVYALHPRAKKMLVQLGLELPGNITVIEPVGFLEALELERRARLILTDSGGIQEEASIFNVPCVTLRDNTERQETVTAGYNMLAGTNPTSILDSAKIMLAKKFSWKPLYGNGTTGAEIVDFLIKEKVV